MLVTASYLAGWLDWLELRSLDLRFMYANSVPEDPRIVCIDIDDNSLATVGRWPWPRDVQAGLLAIPIEMGARALLVDLTYEEPQPLRSRPQPGLDLVGEELLQQQWRHQIALPDEQLRSAIAQGDRTYLAFHYLERALTISAPFERAVRQVAAGQEAEARQWAALREAAGRRDAVEGRGADARPRVFDRVRLAALLLHEPWLSDQAAAERLGWTSPADAALLQEAFPDCHQAALRFRLNDWFAADPARWTQERGRASAAAFADLLASAPDGGAAAAGAFDQALRRVLGEQALRAKCLVIGRALDAAAMRVDGVAPPYFLHARAAHRCGFVNFDPDEGGTVRRLPLIVGDERSVFTQLAFTVGCELLGVDVREIEVRDGSLWLSPAGGDRRIRIQLDRRGRAIVPWVPQRQWQRQFGEHVPADALWTLFDLRARRENERDLLRERRAAVLADPYFGALATYGKNLMALYENRWKLEAARYVESPDAAFLASLVEQLTAALAEAEAQASRLLDSQSAATSPGAAPIDADRLEELRQEWRRIEDEGRRAADLEQEIQEVGDWLRRRLQGRICLVGYTATALADMTPIPTHPRAPGMLAHANLLNGLLVGRTVSWPPAAANASAALAMGALTSVVSALRRPRDGLLLIATLALLVVLSVCVAFYVWTYWIAVTPVLLSLVLSYSTITVYRYIFADSERRQLTTALAQFTSREIARQMAENPELCRRAEMREVTTMFTDLRGFTTISERIGAERTQIVLNACLGGFSEAILRHEGMINKFMGDGIFAFWNPVIYPQPDHARRACEAALDLLEALAQLQERHRRDGGDPTFAELLLRIGVATGNAVVGPCGSEQKYDYTCIGDSVNVAARLESANKFYGTSILVAGAAVEQAGDAFLFRSLGGVQVKGKRQAVPVYELVGRAATAAPEQIRYARAFGDAVALFQQRRFREAAARWADLPPRHPPDLAVEQFARAARALADSPPADDWNGAIELVEK